MLIHWFLAAVHLLAVMLGFWAVLVRGSNFKRLAAGANEVRSVLLADNLWGAFSPRFVGNRRDASVWRV